MSIGPSPNLSGGLWMAGSTGSNIGWGNGTHVFGQGDDCSDNGNNGGGNGGGGSVCTSDGGGGGNSGGWGGSDSGSGANTFFQSGGYAPMAGLPGAGLAGLVCSTPPGGPNPPPVPGPGAPYSQGVSVWTLDGLTGPFSGMPINCADTGVTETSICYSNTFYHNSAGTKHYSVPGASVPNCDGGGSTNLEAASNAADVSVSIEIRCPHT